MLPLGRVLNEGSRWDHHYLRSNSTREPPPAEKRKDPKLQDHPQKHAHPYAFPNRDAARHGREETTPKSAIGQVECNGQHSNLRFYNSASKNPNGHSQKEGFPHGEHARARKCTVDIAMVAMMPQPIPVKMRLFIFSPTFSDHGHPVAYSAVATKAASHWQVALLGSGQIYRH